MYDLTPVITIATIHFIALMSPGPDFALVVQNATRYGRNTGLAIAFGLSCGILLHSVLSITGVSLIVHQHPLLFALMQLIGGGYLLYLGLGALNAVWRLAKSDAPYTPSAAKNQLLSSRRQAFSRGFATNILNPKALVFFISLMSSLVPADMPVAVKTLTIAILFGLSLLWFSFLAWALSTERLQTKLQSATLYIDGLCGLVFTGVGVMIVWQAIQAFTSP
ncbi:Threonine/homoserine/homoserine lactone efflux protein [Vibrio xiamenensis]|uniref:Threonine/homoserine/homoserine lactone efflux protein n=1 Tax=Vibrio xiamenensis TaxID=861298 RepID=A0A1G8DE58_9VIBR|nr:LysE family translocator [Vibrio xiamenensis]SDH55988.1 Threonine/homoserine/homoserine lactone efflux protein [Vibrio xiamenensis]